MSSQTPFSSPESDPSVGESVVPGGEVSDPLRPTAPSPLEGAEPESGVPMLNAIADGADEGPANLSQLDPDPPAVQPVSGESGTRDDQRDGLIGLVGSSAAEPIEPAAELATETGQAVTAPDPILPVVEELAEFKNQVAGSLDGLKGELAELSSQIKISQRGLSTIGQVIQGHGEVFEQTQEIAKTSAETVSRVEEEANMETRRPFIESLMQVHDQLFRRMNAMEAGEKKPDAFVVQLFETLEAEFRQNAIEIIRPEPGGAVELNCMRLLEQVKCPFFRRQDSVAKVYQCGFRYTESARIIRKAEVAVYRKDVGD